MRWITSMLAGFLMLHASLVCAVDPIAESQQAALALKRLADFQGTNPPSASKQLQLVYFTPADREPAPRYRERLEKILEDIRAFYRDGMERLGFGPRTFDVARAPDGKMIIHLVNGSEPESGYPRAGAQQSSATDISSRSKILDESQFVLQRARIDAGRETVLIFCNLANWNPTNLTFSHHSPYAGSANALSGWCFAVDTEILDASNLARKEPQLRDAEWGLESIGRFNTIFIGGIAHELGHAFSLPHCGEREDEKSLGTSLMGIGNHMYREELRGEGRGAFLAMASAMKLIGRPLFGNSVPDLETTPKIQQCAFQLSTNVTRSELTGRRGAVRVEGTVNIDPPVYGVIAYFDSVRDGGYHAPAATSVPDAEGRYAIEISDLAATENGELRMEFCLVNGAVVERRAPFKIPAVR